MPLGPISTQPVCFLPSSIAPHNNTPLPYVFLYQQPLMDASILFNTSSRPFTLTIAPLFSTTHLSTTNRQRTTEAALFFFFCLFSGPPSHLIQNVLTQTLKSRKPTNHPTPIQLHDSTNMDLSTSILCKKEILERRKVNTGNGVRARLDKTQICASLSFDASFPGAVFRPLFRIIQLQLNRSQKPRLTIENTFLYCLFFSVISALGACLCCCLDVSTMCLFQSCFAMI